MTNTNEDIELLVCSDCAVVIANGDISGLEDANAHLAAMDERWGDYYLIITCSGDDCSEGFHHSECEGCGGLAGDRHRAIARPNEF